MTEKLGEVISVAPWTSLDLSREEVDVYRMKKNKFKTISLLLNLKENRIGCEKVRMISEGLKRNCTLTELDLSCAE